VHRVQCRTPSGDHSPGAQRAYSSRSQLDSRQNCEACGRVFCDACTQQRMFLPADWQTMGLSRVCNSCAIGISAIHQVFVVASLHV
jgi:hypothetical protein